MTISSANAIPTETDRQRGEVFVDVAALTVMEPAPDRRHDGRRIVAPGAMDAFTLLGESHDVVVIAEGPVDDVPELAFLRALPSIPTVFPSGSWYLTAEETWCEGDRPIGLRSILVGPKRPPTKRPTARCDIEARDLSAAAMEILIREAMA